MNLVKVSLFAYGQDPATGLNFYVPDFDKRDLLVCVTESPQKNCYYLRMDEKMYFVLDLYLKEVLCLFEEMDFSGCVWGLRPCTPYEYLELKADRFSHFEIYRDSHDILRIYEFPSTIKEGNRLFHADYQIWGVNMFGKGVCLNVGFGEFSLNDLCECVLDELAKV